MNENTQAQKKSKKGLAITLGIIAALLLGGNIFQYYLKHKDNKTIETQAVKIDTQEDEIVSHTASIDSLQQNIQLKIDSLSAIGEDVEKLEIMHSELSDLASSLKKKNVSLRYSRRKLNERLQGFEALLKQKDEKIEALSLTVTAQGDLIQEKNQVIIRKELDFNELEKTSLDQNDIIKIAKVVKADKFKVVAVKNGKIKVKDVYKSKDLETMQVSFDLMPNEVADVETKVLYVVLRDPSGSPIYDLSTGGGEFDFDGGQSYYTRKIESLYERSGKHVVFSVDAIQSYRSGKHSIGIYTTEKMIGETSFEVK